MATNPAPFPTPGESPYSDKVQDYIDAGDDAVEAAAKSDATSKVTAHEAKPDPHPQYETAAEVAAKITAHKTESNAHAAANLTYAGGPGGLASGTVEQALDDLDARRFSASIPSGTNLNTLTTAGTYSVIDTTWPTTALNFPFTGWSGQIEVIGGSSGTHVLQRATFFNPAATSQLLGNQRQHFRAYVSGTWTSWQAVGTEAAVTLTSSDNLNDITRPGSYLLQTTGSSTANNWPITGFQGIVLVNANSSETVVVQTAIASHSSTGGQGTMWTRTRHSSWGAWQENSVTNHEAKTNPHSQYARLAALNEFTTRQTVATSGLQHVLRRSNAPEDLGTWGLYGETDGSLVIDPLHDDLSTYPGSGRMRIYRDGRIERGGIREIVGTGDPNGVHAAPVGSVFRNTEAGGYNGARVWRKDTGGSGSSGWVVESGDTGWRSVPITPPENHPGLTEMKVRRIDGTVFVSLMERDISSLAGTGFTSLGSPPQGFRTVTGIPSASLMINSQSGAGLPGAALYMSSGSIVIYRAGAFRHAGTVTFPANPADGPWPTTLPGTPA